jgi:FkbM family methyltransferase
MFGPGGRARKYARAFAQSIYSSLASNPIGAVVGEVAITDGLARVQRVRHGGVEFQFAVPTGLTKWRADTFATKEPGTLSWIDGFSAGDVFWDVGANVGLYSIYAALARNCSVVAFEPSVFNVECLTRNINLNKVVRQVSLVLVALSDVEGFQEFRTSTFEWGGALSGFGEMPAHGGKNLDVQCAYRTWGTTLDLMAKKLGSTPDHLKIDVDGIESLILQGGRETLLKVSGVLVEIETDDTTRAAEISRLLTAAGLSLSSVENFSWAGARNEIWRRAQ